MRGFLSFLYAGIWFIINLFTAAAPGNITVFELTPSTVGVEKFLEWEDAPDPDWNGDCYCVMPLTLSQESGLELYKYDGCCYCALVYEGVRYPVGLNFGGYGITNCAFADMNADGALELYYAFSWGSGIHRGMFGSFDIATKKETFYDISFLNGDLWLRANGDTIEVCEALMLDVDHYCEIRAIPGRTLATLFYADGEVQFKLLVEDS